MSRVSSFGHHQVMLNALLNNQSKLFSTQKQINTGKKTDEFRGIAGEAQTLLSAKSMKNRTEGYLATLKDVQRKLTTNDINLKAMEQAADDLRQTIVEGMGLEKAVAFDEALQQAVSVILNAINANIDNVYIFGGSRTNTPPVAALTLADLVAAPDAASLFQNDGVQLTSRIGDNVEMTYGVLASDVAVDLLTSLKALADFNAGPDGPIDGPLTPAQRAFLETELANLVAGIDTVRSITAQNGLRQNRAEAMEVNQIETNDFLEVFVSDIEDVNIAEALMRINMDQLALEASYRIMAELGRMSLVNFI